MPNRNMAAKNAKAASQRGEYATQASYRDLSAPKGDMMMWRGKLVPRPEPVTLEQLKHLKAERADKVLAQRELAIATREALGKRTRFAWSR